MSTRKFSLWTFAYCPFHNDQVAPVQANRQFHRDVCERSRLLLQSRSLAHSGWSSPTGVYKVTYLPSARQLESTKRFMAFTPFRCRGDANVDYAGQVAQ